MAGACSCCTTKCCGIASAIIAVLLGIMWWDITSLPRSFEGTTVESAVEEFYSEWKWENIAEYYWDDHLHLGYWEHGGKNETWDLATMRRNKVKLIEKHLAFGLEGVAVAQEPHRDRHARQAAADSRLRLRYRRIQSILGASLW
jgi:hypothetical protein